jgi:hypothetical protein
MGGYWGRWRTTVWRSDLFILGRTSYAQPMRAQLFYAVLLVALTFPQHQGQARPAQQSASVTPAHQTKPARRKPASKLHAIARSPRSVSRRARAGAAARCRDVFCTTQVLRMDGDSGEVQGLTEEQVETTMQLQRKKLEPCLVEARRGNPRLSQAHVEFVVTGKGQVLATRVDGKQASPLARCVHQQLRSVRFPSFKLSRTIAAITMAAPQ